MEDVSTPAPAPTPEPTTISAAVDAASRDDFSAFDAAHQSEKRGEAVPRVEAPKAAAPVETERTLSKRQEAANERTREAVDRATADLRAELDRVKAQIAAPKAPTEAPAPSTPAYKRYMALPDAPKLADFESVEEHAIAAALFVNETREAERTTAQQQRQSEDSRTKELTTIGQQYGERLAKAAAADPEIGQKITPAILTARPLSGLSPAELQTATFANAVAEAGLYSEDPAALYLHLSQHEADASRIAALSPSNWLRALAQLDGRISAGTVTTTAATPTTSTAAPAARPSTITAAPPPVLTPAKTGTTNDPKAAALARDDFAAFDRIDQQERAARRGHA